MIDPPLTNRCLPALLLVAWLLAAAPPAPAGTSFGVRTQIWPFLFVTDGAVGPGATTDEQIKAAVTIGNLDRYVTIGAHWNIVDVWQEVDGPDGWVRLDQVMAEHERRGIQAALRLLERPEIYDDVARGGDDAGRALAEYHGWVGQLAARYGSRARCYMISNEADHDIGHNRPVYRRFRPVTVDEYGRLLAIAYRAIKDVDPRLVVADHGVSAYSLALAVMQELALAGRPDEALAFWRTMAYEAPGDGDRNMTRMISRLASADARHRIEFARRTVADLAPYRDVYQLHHYHGPVILPRVLAWVRRRLGAAAAQPIMAGEVGYLVPARAGMSWDGRPMNVADMSRYSEVDHGISLAKNLAILAGSGVGDVLYWQLRFHVDRDTAASLYPPSAQRDDFRPGNPARVFGFLAGELSRASAVDAGPSGGGLVEYRFHHESEFSVAWAAGDAPITLDPARSRNVARVVDATGAPLAGAGWDGRIGPAPVVVYWTPGAGDPAGK